MRKKSFPTRRTVDTSGWLYAAIAIIFLLITTIFGYTFGKKIVSSLKPMSLQSFIPGWRSQTALFTGTLTRIPEDLQICKKTEMDEVNDFIPSTVYYSAGVYTKGKYKGYERIIAVREPLGPGDALVYVFATKDRKTYVLHEEDSASTLFPDTDWRNPFNVIDKTKVSKVDQLPLEHPQTMSLNTTFSLYRNSIVTQNVPSGKTSKEGYEVYENIVRSDFSDYEALTVPKSHLTFFGVIHPPQEIPDEWEEDAQVQAQLRAKFIKGTTRVIAVDSSGLPYTYTLTRQSEIDQYEKNLKHYTADSIKYEKERIRFENKEINDLPEYPMPPSLPNLRFLGTDIRGSTEVFTSYDIAVPYICGIDVDMPVIQQIPDSELMSFGTVFGHELFILKDPEHPFYKLAYRNKMLMSKEEFEMINKGMKKLTYEEYVAKHPVLFFKDFWGRWVAAGEYDYKMIGGCGKPVLYFYPEKPTDVIVSFAKPVDVTYAIPSYTRSWYVEAQPDGTLTDLQPDLTDCDLIDSTKFGSEYAKIACENNQYPYLYWAGNRVGMRYPFNPALGWIVGREELWQFLSEKVDEVGFTENEKYDFLSYWIPVMLEKGAPWYHVRFLQTNDMNMFIPMYIHPTPDRYYRLFLDWKPLTAIPEYPVLPQPLDPIVRKGFTVVEWGGLKQ